MGFILVTVKIKWRWDWKTQALNSLCVIIFFHVKVPAIYALLGYTGMFLVAAGIAALGIIISLLLPKRLTCQDSINKVICS